MERKEIFVNLYNCDCLKKIEKIDDKSIDYVITSPPYNMNLRINKGRYVSRQIVKEFSTKYKGFSDNLPIEEYYEFHKKVMQNLLRITKKHIFYIIQPITGNKRALFKLIGDFHNKIKEIIIWNKITAQPAMAERVMNSTFEFIIVLSDDENDSISRQFTDASFDRGTLNNVWNIKRSKSADKNHSATFPKELISQIISKFTKEGDVILDPFMGTATTGEVCIENNRSFIGIELIKDYYNFAKKRLKKYR